MREILEMFSYLHLNYRGGRGHSRLTPRLLAADDAPMKIRWRKRSRGLMERH